MEESKKCSNSAPIFVCEADRVDSMGHRNGTRYRFELYANRIVILARQLREDSFSSRNIISIANILNIQYSINGNEYFSISFRDCWDAYLDYKKTEELKKLISILEELL